MEKNFKFEGGKNMHPLIEGLSIEETKKNFEMAGASSEEIEKLLQLGDKAKDTIIQVTMRQWEDDPKWASQIMHNTLIELGIREEKK